MLWEQISIVIAVLIPCSKTAFSDVLAVAKIKVVLVVPSTTMNCNHYFFSVKISSKKCLDHFFNGIQTLNGIIIPALLSCPKLLTPCAETVLSPMRMCKVVLNRK